MTTTIQRTNTDYDLVIKRLHLYYDMKLAKFSVDRDRKSYNTISSLHTAIHTTTANTVSVETVPVPVIDQNTQAHSYTHL